VLGPHHGKDPQLGEARLAAHRLDDARVLLAGEAVTFQRRFVVGWRRAHDWTLTAGVTNLTDKRFLTSGGSNLADGTIFGTYNPPREWYARFGFKF